MSEGGAACAAVEIALASGHGVVLGGTWNAAKLFGEDQARYLLCVHVDHAEEVVARIKRELAPADANAITIGGIRHETIVGWKGFGPVAVADIRAAHEGWLPGYMAGAS